MKVKSPQEIAVMREGGKILADIVRQLESRVKPGVTTKELDTLAQSLFSRHGKASFKGYNGFPGSICTSINEEIVHGVPSDRVLKEGDVLSIDAGLFYKGFHSDMATTVAVGRVDDEVARLIRVTKKALKRGIKKLRPGITVGDLGNTIERYVESQGFCVVDGLCGHGIGVNLHEEPDILNYGLRHKGEILPEGLVICIEPMLCLGKPDIDYCQNGITIKTKDNSISAHFEHTIAITGNGAEVLTV